METSELETKKEKDLCCLKENTLDMFHKIRNDLVHLRKISKDFEKCLAHIRESIEIYEDILIKLRESSEDSDGPT